MQLDNEYLQKSFLVPHSSFSLFWNKEDYDNDKRRLKINVWDIMNFLGKHLWRSKFKNLNLLRIKHKS